MKIEKLVDTASAITDPRRQYGNKRHELADIIVIGLCTILCKGEDFTDMEDFSNEREEWLRAFLEVNAAALMLAALPPCRRRRLLFPFSVVKSTG